MKSQHNTDELLKRFSVVDVLSICGKRTDHVSSMYWSPWSQDESTPSFHVKTNPDGSQIWTCFSSDVPDGILDRLAALGGRRKTMPGGGVLDLVALLQDLPDRESAARFLAGYAGWTLDTPDAAERVRDAGRSSAMKVVGTRPGVDRPALLRYMCCDRGLSPECLHYCETVAVSYSNSPDRRYYYAGMANNRGGYALRNSGGRLGSLGKISTRPGWYTAMSPSGARIDSATTERVLVFEGFINFLSYLTVYNRERSSCDVCILNSVSFTESAMPFLLSHREVGCCLDNDRAGRKAAARIMERCGQEGVSARDLSSRYSQHDDLNDMLLSMKGIVRGDRPGDISLTLK